MSSSPSASSQTLYRTLLIESNDVGDDSLSPILGYARFLVERCATPAEAVELYRDHDLVLIRAQDGIPAENLRHLVSWLRHNSVEGAAPFTMIVAGQSVIAQLNGMSCDMLDERSVETRLPEHLKEVRGYLDATRKHGDASFWSRLFGRSQASDTHAELEVSDTVSKERKVNSASKKIVETKTGQHMNSPKREGEPETPTVAAQPVKPLVPREKVATLKMVPREVMPFRRPLELSLIAPILLREISDAAVVLGQDYRVIEANGAWLNLFATEKGHVLGSVGVEFKTGFDKMAWANILHRALLGREFDADRDALSPPIQSLKVRPIPSNDGTPVGVLILCTSAGVSDLEWPQNTELRAELESRVRAELEPDIERQKVRINDLSRELAVLRERIHVAEAEAKSAQDTIDDERALARAAQHKHELQRVRFDELVDALASARSIGDGPNRKAESLLAKVGAPKIDVSLLNYAPFGIVRLSSDGEVMFANSQVDELMGLSITRGQSFIDWIAKGRPSDETSAALVDEWTDKVWRRQMTCVVQVAGEGGLLKDVEFRPTLMDDGGLLVFISDVTDRQQVYDALRSAEMKFRGVFRSAVAGVALMDGEGAIYDANVTFCEMFAQTRGDVCSTTLSALVQGCNGEQASVTSLKKTLRITLPCGEQALLASPGTGCDENEMRAIFCVPASVERSLPSAASSGDACEGIQMMTALEEDRHQLAITDGVNDKVRSSALARWLGVLSVVIKPDHPNEVDIARVVRGLIEETHHRLGEAVRAHVSFDAPVDEQFVPRAVAIPLALAISELIENAIQHGLKNGVTEGLVRVHFTRGENEIVTEICDTGAVLRPDFKFERHAGEGLKLVRLLATRVGGKLSIDPGAETRCQLNIPLR